MNPQRLVFNTPHVRARPAAYHPLHAPLCAHPNRPYLFQAQQVVQALEKMVEKLVQERRKEEENHRPNYMPGATFRSTLLTHKKPF